MHNDVSIGKEWNIRIYRNTEDGIACEDIDMDNGEEKSITIQPCEALMIELFPIISIGEEQYAE